MVEKIDTNLLQKLNELEPFKLNCNVFSVYDYDCDTIQELLCMFFTKINECIEICNLTVELAKWLVSEGLEIEVAKKLEEWLVDGTLAEIINETLFKELNNKIANNTILIGENTTQINNNKESIKELENNFNDFKRKIVLVYPSMSVDEINTILNSDATLVIFTKGDYMVSPDNYLKVHNGGKRILFEGGIIKQTVIDSGFYVMFEVRHCEDVIVDGILVDGGKPLKANSDYATEWGYGVEVTSAKNIHILRPRIENTTGDGIYVGYKWEETIPVLKKTSDIYVKDCFIKSCSRNGISICSGDNLYFENVYVDDIFRKFPKSGIDIEPENSNRQIIHLNNVNIDNLTTRKTDCGIIVANGYEGVCNININNHQAFDTYVGLYLAENQSTGVFNYRNSVHNKPNYNSIKFGRIKNNMAINIDNLIVNGRGEPSSESVEINSCLFAFDGTGVDFELGGININNVRLKNVNGYNYLYTLFSNGSSKDFLNVSVNNITCCNDKLPTNRIPKLVKPIITNCDTVYDTNYYDLSFNESNCPHNAFISNGISDNTKRTYYNTIPDGKYLCGTNRVNGLTLTIEFSGLTVLGQNSNIFTSNNDACILEFIKKGNEIYITNKVNFN